MNTPNDEKTGKHEKGSGIWTDQDIATEYFKTFVDQDYTIVFVKNEEGRYEYVDKTWEEIFGKTLAEIQGRTDFELFRTEVAERPAETDKEALRMDKPSQSVETFSSPDGSLTHWFVFKFALSDDSGRRHVCALALDMTDQMRAEERVIRLSRFYSLLSSVNQTILRAREEPEKLLGEACRVGVEKGDLRMVWVGLIDPNERLLKPVAHHGFEDGYLESAPMSIDNVSDELLPSVAAIREGKPIVVDDVERDQRMGSWRRKAVVRGYKSIAAFPLRKGTDIVGSIGFNADERKFFDDESIRLLTELSADVSYALEFAEKDEARKRAEQAVAAKEEFYRTLTEESSDFVLILAADGTVSYVSPSMERVIGYKPELVVRDPFALIHPDDVPVIVESLRLMLEKGSPPQKLDLRVKHADGTWRYVSARARNLLADPVVKGIVVNLRDITERKQAEQALRESQSLLQMQISRMPIGYIVWDTSFKVVTWNPAAEQIFGFAASEAEGKHPYDIIVPKEAQPQVDDIWSRLLKGDMTAHSVNENFTKDGRKIICEWTNTPLKQDDGAVLGALSMVQDTTERRRMEDELKRYSEHLEELVQERTKALRQAERMAAIGEATLWVGHDLRNPLQVMLNATYSLKEHFGKAPSGIAECTRCAELVREHADFVGQQLRYMDKIVSDLHDYAAPVKVEPVEADPRQLIVDALSNASPPDSIKVSVGVEEGLSKLMVDPAMIGKVFVNLIRNAVEAMPEGGRLTIQASKVGNNTSITFEDMGIGIAEENMSKIFEPFFTTKAKGQGLGLAVCKKLIEAHGGAIAVESEIGKGTKVIVTIPSDPEGKTQGALGV